MSDVVLSGNNTSVVLHGGAYSGPGLALTGLQGWYETPSSKVTVTARGQGDGGHDIPASDILYESRTVTVGYRVVAGDDRARALSELEKLDRLVHGLVTCRVIDNGRDERCERGYSTRTLDQKIQNPLCQNLTGDITIVFQRPERLSTSTLRFQLHPASAGDNGLRYGDGKLGLQYPLTYGVAATDSRNVGTIRNDGTSRAYPVFTVSGSFSYVSIMFPGTTLSLDYSQPVGATPLVLDCRSRTATMGGLDVSRNLRSRGFPTVPAGGSLSVNLQSAGSGWVTVTSHNTYM